MGISFGSINTGLPKDIVKQIIDAEKIPLTKMETSKANIGEKKTLMTELMRLVQDAKGIIAKNATARSLRELKVETNEDIVGVVADKNVAAPGSHQFEVEQLARRSSAMTSGFEDPESSYVGVGFVQYFLPDGESKSIYIDSDHSTLKGIAQLINRDTKAGMKAMVVNDGTGSDEPWRIIITLDETGDGQNAQFPYMYFVDGEKDFYLEFEREAQDAIVKLDGFEIELPENKTSDLIPGLAIDLRKAAPGTEFTIKVSEDVDAIQAKVNDLVVKVNEIIQFIKTQNNLDQNTDTSKTLGGDSSLQSIESRLRSAIFTWVDTEFGPRRIGDLGVTFQRDGLLGLDANKLNSKISADFEEVGQILSGRFLENGQKTNGFIDNLNDVLGSAVRVPDGLLESRKRGFQSKIDQIDRRISTKQRLIEQKEKGLKDRFARLESEIAKIKGQGAGLAALGGASQGNIVQQLG